MWLFLVGYLVSLFHAPHAFDPVKDGALALSAQWLPALACWVAALTRRPRRVELALCAAAVTSHALGNTYYVLSLAGERALPFPSPSDAGFLAFFPFMLAALAVTVHRQLPRFQSSVALDSLLGSLASASLLAIVLGSVLEGAVDEKSALRTAVAVAYPLGDLLVVAAVVAILALRGFRVDGRWLLLVAGLALFTVADVVYAFQVLAGTYRVGTLLDAGWVLALGLFAAWTALSQTDAPAGEEGGPAPSTAALTVPALATVIGVLVLFVGAFIDLPPLAEVLAGLTALAAAIRTQIAFRGLLRMADLRRLAGTDDLTGLPNRRALYADVPRVLAVGTTQEHALLLLDLDRFKEVNDSLGHQAGDRLLMEVAARLDHELRPDDLLARLGGDEFAVLLTGAGSAEATAVAAKLRHALAAPFELEGITLHTGVSVGIALFPTHGRTLSSLLKQADVAMYQAKRTRAGYRVATGEDTHGDDRLRTQEELRGALGREELVLHYQPQLDLPSGAVTAVEALVRWNHPTRGLLYPDSFLAAAEDAGLMHELTRAVLRMAMDQASRWQAQGRFLRVAVNLSASSLVDDDLPQEVLALLTERDLPAGCLQLEITEEFLMADRDRARSILARIRDRGVQISIDDFGTGYSSLAYLRELPIDELKLDRSFVFPMADDARAAALVASTIGLAHSLGMRMVAEGVESQAALDELVRYGCDVAQGFTISRPVPAAALEFWLDERALLATASPSRP